jgi:hypothetical protein
LGGLRFAETPGILDPWVGVNLRRQPWSDIRVRRALDLVIDRKQMIRNLAFGAGKLNGPIPWGNERWALPQAELEERYKVDKAEARRLFEAAGVTAGHYPPRDDGPAARQGIGEFLKEQLAEFASTSRSACTNRTTGSDHDSQARLRHMRLCLVPGNRPHCVTALRRQGRHLFGPDVRL